MEAIKIVNYVIMVLFFACYAYQFLYIPIALLKKEKAPAEGETAPLWGSDCCKK